MILRVSWRFGLIALLSLGSCGAPIVTQSAVNHAYEGRLQKLIVFNNLFEDLRQSLTTSFDTQFIADMGRCGVQVKIVDGVGFGLNPKAQLVAAAQEIQADTLLNAIWTKREKSHILTQYSLFTLSQIAHRHETSLGEVWKTEILQVIGPNFGGDNDGTLLARRIVDQLEHDKMLQNCKPRPMPTSPG